MLRARSGSALVVTMVMTAFLSMVTLAWWYRASLWVEMQHDREMFYANLSLADTLFSYASVVAKNQFGALLANLGRSRGAHDFDCTAFVRQVTGDDNVAACVRFKPVAGQDDRLHIFAFVKRNEKVECAVRGILVKVSAYDIVTKKIKKRFFIESFTLGADV